MRKKMYLNKMKTRTFPNRHVLSICVLLVIALVLLHDYPYNKPFQRIQTLQLGTKVSPRANTTNNKLSKPPPLRGHIPFSKNGPGKELSKHSWKQPMVLTSYARPLDNNPAHTELFVYVTGVTLGNYARNISVVGCILGKDIFKGIDASGEVFICEIPRKVVTGERVSLVLARDENLVQALNGITIGKEVVKMYEDELIPLTGLKKPEMVMLKRSTTVTKVSATARAVMQRGRYKVCMGTQIKIFGHLLGDWVGYHRRLGVDMVYILDNGAEEDVERLVGGIQGVEVLYWPFEKSQTQAMSYMVVVLREFCEWVLLSDVDEYVLLGLDEKGGVGGLREYLDGVSSDIGQVFLGYLTMGISGHTKMLKGPLAEGYIYKHGVQKINGKVIARCDWQWLSSRIHFHKGRYGRGEHSVVLNERPGFGEQPLMIHFQKRSFEEFVKKRVTGSGSVADTLLYNEFVVGGLVPRYYRERLVDEGLRYTYFRDVWRLVLQQPMKQVLV